MFLQLFFPNYDASDSSSDPGQNGGMAMPVDSGAGTLEGSLDSAAGPLSSPRSGEGATSVSESDAVFYVAKVLCFECLCYKCLAVPARRVSLSCKFLLTASFGPGPDVATGGYRPRPTGNKIANCDFGSRLKAQDSI